MNSLFTKCASSNAKKEKCPYMEKCYRKNPIHFNEMSHPHLEKLVIDQLDGAVTVPARLDFECSDRSNLLDQLKVLQMVLRTERNKNARSSSPVTVKKEAKSETSGTKVKTAKTEISQDLLEKIERNKMAAIARKEAKLREMDSKAALLVKPSTSDSGDPFGRREFKSDEEDVTEIEEEKERKQNTPGIKRSSNVLTNESSSAKKSKADSGSENGKANGTVQSIRTQSDDNTPSSTSQGSSIIEEYTAGCSNSSKRLELRKKTIEKMRRHGHDISIVEPGEFPLKYALSAPYYLFFTRVEHSKPTYSQKYSITFPELLDQGLGEIVRSLHFNFIVDVGWLCLQYLLAAQRTDMLILHQERADSEKLPSNIKLITVDMPTQYGCHHSKVMVLKYRDNGIRVVVSTANLYADDWENRAQGLWLSPHLPQLPDSANPSDGESPTGFKRDFERYLQKYKQPALTEWLYAVRRADFSEVNVFFVGSVPGYHKDVERDSWGYRKVASVLSKHATLPANAPYWPLIAQCSSIGSLGPKYESWLLKEIVPAMSSETNKGLKSLPNFQFIYPTIDNYKNSFDMLSGSSCLPYSIKTHEKQKWIESYMYQWKATGTARDRAIPHIKTYTRVSPDFKEIPWFVLTSANLSKAAWGSMRGSHYVMSYEAGVIFTPKLVTGKTTFPIMGRGETPDGSPGFPIPYDLPLTRYNPGDKPFVGEFFMGYE